MRVPLDLICPPRPPPEMAHDFRRLALEHPNMVPLLVTRPLATPLGHRPIGMLWPLEDVLTLLTSAGLGGADALHIYRVLFGYRCRKASSARKRPTISCA